MQKASNGDRKMPIRIASLLLIGALLIFDIAFSILSTCQSIGMIVAKHSSYGNHCTVLGGIIPWILGAILHHIHWFLEQYEHSLIAGFTIVLGISTIGLWVSTRNLWEAGERQIKTSRAVAALQARNARRQLLLAENSAEMELRAYLIVKPFTFGFENGRPVVEILSRNIGKSSAVNIEAFSRMKMVPHPIEGKDLPIVLMSNQPTIYLQPTDELNFPVRQDPGDTFTAEDVDQMCMIGAASRLCIWGHLTYLDVFGKKREMPFAWTVAGGPAMRNLLNGVKGPEGWTPRFEMVRSQRNPI